MCGRVEGGKGRGKIIISTGRVLLEGTEARDAAGEECAGVDGGWVERGWRFREDVCRE